MTDEEFDAALIGYTKMMDEINRRIEFIRQDWMSRQIPSNAAADFAAIQLRKLCEIMTFVSLIANEATYSRHYKNYSNHWRLRDIADVIKKDNPIYFPRPCEDDGKSDILNYLEGDEFLTENDVFDIYDECGDYLHFPNPFKPYKRGTLDTFIDNFLPKIDRFERTLEQHCIFFFDKEPTRLAIIHMHGNKDGGPIAYRYRCLGKHKG